LLIAGILIYLRNSIIKRETERNRIENEKNEATRVHEMDLMKLRFFANISHELRTPLTLILGPVDRILKSLFSGIQPEVIQQQLALVYRNSLRMEHLITEIMDTFKIESGTVKLRIQETDFVKFIKEIAQVFDSIANEKKLKFTVDSPEKTVPVWIDNEKIEKVLYNLLSNAFKFTESGEVKVTIQYIFEGNESYPAGYVAVRVTDTGCGMDENEAQEVFKRFFQANNQSKSGQAGTGLGMALTKELVELHKGIITVKSELNKGTEYEFRLHLGNEQLSADEIAGENEKYDNRNIQTIQMLANAELDLQKVEEEVQSRKKLPLLLIVEDNKDLVVYLKSMLNEKYRIEVAYNGKNGWLLAQELLPDLILSDVMMPEMDGFEMTKLIKTNAATCHIPVLLLTARDADNYRIEGLETGAFDYMVKPFNAEVLNLKIRNIQKNQEDLRRFYAESWKNPAVDRSEFVATDVHIPSSDNSFLEKIKNFLQDNIKNSSFTVDMLAAHLNMSVRNMNRKINSLLNSSALELMTEMRLNKAKVLFEESDLNVAEISFQCGFIDSNYFGKCFKRFTGLSPKEYRANQKKSNTELQ
jgi:signal transduction histidine kinase/DNA-binding response OmpR family regulator